MAMEGFWVCACAAALLNADVPSSSTASGAAAQREDPVAVTLAVQMAMVQAKDALFRNDPVHAVQILESRMHQINGNSAYLALLRDAYREAVRVLRLGNQEAQAQIYQQRLLNIEPTGSRDPSGRLASSYAAGGSAAPSPGKTPAGPTFRAMREDPFEQVHAAPAASARELISQAEQQFKSHHFQDANLLFARAHDADEHSTDGNQQSWAYCMLYHVVEQLNQNSASYDAMEKEIRSAMGLRSSLNDSYGKQLLAEIEDRRRRAAKPNVRSEESALTAFRLRDLGQTPEGWHVAETENFRIYHNLSNEWLQETARIAERTRAEMQRKWFGATEVWSPKCELYLHATAQDYSRVTGVPSASPGHSTFNHDGERVLSRRIDVHCDHPGMLTGVLPHETTHVVLAGKFGERPVPRWADEGIAVLTEPRAKIEDHLSHLPQMRQAQQLFEIRQLMQMPDYPPDPHAIGPFYAESVSVVEYLSNQKGPAEFTRFVRDGMRYGYDWALQNHYGCTFDDLEQRWLTYAFGNYSPPTGMARGSH